MTSDMAGSTTIWSALNDWGKTLPDWQRFIVSYAVRDGELSTDRIGEAYRLFERSAELDDGKAELPVIPTSVTGRADQSNSGPMSLQAINNLQFVNAIPNDATLTFGNGITIVYGENGAGKSGFARIMSSACFSRSKQKILPNVYSAADSVGPPSANFIIKRGNAADETIPFSEGDENSELLRASVFDSSIARVHLAEETPLGFKPVGFDVFDELTKAIATISNKLDSDIQSRNAQNKFGQIFLGESDIATTVTTLSKDTDITALRTLAAFGTKETERLIEIDRQLEELRAASPAEILKSLASAKKDIGDVRRNIDAVNIQLGPESCERLTKELSALSSLTTAASTIDPKTFGTPDLKATGSPEWVEFVERARNLAALEKENYPELGDPCLLCHRPLDEPSATLIKRFWGFLDDETRAAAELANETVSASSEALKKLDINFLPLESRIRADLSKNVADSVPLIDGVSKALDDRRNSLVAALDNGKVDFPLEVFEIPDSDLDKLVADIEQREVQLREGSVDEAVAKLQTERGFLRHRQVLNQNIDDIEAFIKDQKWIDKAQKKKRSALTTRFITDKQKELFGKLIEGRYKSRLDDECKALDCILPVEFKARGSGGQTLRGLKIQGGHKPTDILSEGEQRAVALADFLTEVNLNPISAAIVLDDPVTSMDHKRKRLIAGRLAEEASSRQVIVFTHDLVFMTFLLEQAEKVSVGAETHWVERTYEGEPGNVMLNECPANSNAYKTPHRAKEDLAQAKKASGQQRVDKIRSGAAALRNTLEEIVIRDLLKGTVRRWDEQIRLGSVTSIVWSDSVADEISALQDEISRLIEAHSTSDEYSGGMPDLADLEKLIARVEAVQTHAKMKRK